MKLSDVAKLIGGTLIGDGDLQIVRCSSIESASEGSITVMESSKFAAKLANSNASAVILPAGMECNIPYISCELPMFAFTLLLSKLHEEPLPNIGIHESAFLAEDAVVAETARIGAGSHIGAGSTIGENSTLHDSAFIGIAVTIGKNCIIHAGAKIINGTVMGDNVIIHSGTVIGSDGFKYCKGSNGTPVKVPHIGKVKIGNHVEIESNCCVDRGFLDDTVIEDYVKLDNLVHISHNVRIKQGAMLAGQFGVAGSTTIGSGVMTGGQVGIPDHVTIADGAIFAGKSGVTGDVKKAGLYGGIPAKPLMKWKKTEAAIGKLPELIKRVTRLEKQAEKNGEQNE